MEIINLRDAPHHLPTIARWFSDEWGHLCPSLTLEVRIEMMKPYLNRNPIPTMLIGVEGETVLGTAALVESDMGNRFYPELTPWLASVYVRKDLRGRGLGRQMVKALMDFADQQGVPRLYLFTTNQAAFYAKLGWETYSEEIYEDTPVTIMQLDYE